MSINIIKKGGVDISISILNRDILEELYYGEKLSIRDIKDVLGVSYESVRINMKKYGITREKQLLSYRENDIQRDLLIGSRLGDGSFISYGNNHRVSFSHAENQKAYLELKLELMKEFCKKATLNVSDWNQRHSNAQLIYYFHTRSLPLFNKYKKMSNIELVSELNANSLLVWLMDDGSYDVQNKFWRLAAYRFTEDELKETSVILERRFGLRPVIDWIRRDRTSYKGSKYSGLRFNKRDSDRIDEIIKASDFYHELVNTNFYKIVR